MTGRSTRKWPSTAWSCSRSTNSASTRWTGRSWRRPACRFRGGPVGLSTLAVAVGEEPETVEDVYEPFLLQLGMLMRTPRGRVATPAGLAAPRSYPAAGAFAARPGCRWTATTATGRLRPSGVSGASASAGAVGQTGWTLDVPSYDLPEEAIAQVPADPRDSARLLVALGPEPAAPTGKGSPEPSRRGGRPGGQRLAGGAGPAAAAQGHRRGRRGAPLGAVAQSGPAAGKPLCAQAGGLPPGTLLYAGELAVVEVGEALADGSREVTSLVDDLSAFGSLALPPYVHTQLAEPGRYQTVYADRPGSVAAPTAGLHLTHEVLAECVKRGPRWSASSWRSGSGRSGRSKAARSRATSCTPSGTRCPKRTWEACKRAKRVRRGRHDDGASPGVCCSHRGTRRPDGAVHKTGP